MPTLNIYYGNNENILPSLSSRSFNLIYIDPPFNTGKLQKLSSIKTSKHKQGDRVGFKGDKYKTVQIGSMSFNDVFYDYLQFILPSLQESYRLLTDNGSFFLHLDYREVHYCKILLDQIFGRENFINEIIWSYDYGARSRSRWSTKHDTILWYVKNNKDYTFNYDNIDRIPYMAPNLVGAEKAERGKTPTDVWWHTIVPTNSKERTGYPTQKPIGIINRIVTVHSNPGDLLLDFFAGSGTLGESAIINNRSCTLIDNNYDAIQVMIGRLEKYNPNVYVIED